MNELEAAAKIIEIVPYLRRVVVAEVRRQLDSEHGVLTLTHLQVMGHARRHPGCSLGDIARARDVSLPTMSKMVSSLVERGLLTRTQDPENRRLVRIEITPEGEEIFLTVLGRVQRRIAEWLVPISSEERETIVQALERLVTLFAAEGEVRQHLPLPIVTDIP